MLPSAQLCACVRVDLWPAFARAVSVCVSAVHNVSRKPPHFFNTYMTWDQYVMQQASAALDWLMVQPFARFGQRLDSAAMVCQARGLLSPRFLYYHLVSIQGGEGGGG